jgi:hypothetical protein
MGAGFNEVSGRLQFRNLGMKKPGFSAGNRYGLRKAPITSNYCACGAPKTWFLRKRGGPVVEQRVEKGMFL